ncbi:MAG TPA: hypothetical protein VJX30_01780 [Terriglobales bacterium]|nr:hypothetical protein [Terriglobales bacterium]
MFEYLEPRDGPVIDGMESQEIVYAADQPEYIPLRTLIGPDVQMAGVVSRWSLTPAQRKLVADGADIFLELSTFGNPLQPIRMAVGDGKIECPMDSVFSIRVPGPTAIEMHDREFTKAIGIKEG